MKPRRFVLCGPNHLSAGFLLPLRHARTSRGRNGYAVVRAASREGSARPRSRVWGPRAPARRARYLPAGIVLTSRKGAFLCVFKRLALTRVAKREVAANRSLRALQCSESQSSKNEE